MEEASLPDQKSLVMLRYHSENKIFDWEIVEMIRRLKIKYKAETGK